MNGWTVLGVLVIAAVVLGALFASVRFIGHEMARLYQSKLDSQRLQDLVDHEIALEDLELRAKRLLERRGDGGGSPA